MKGEFTQKGKEAMERFKVESANEVGVNLKQDRLVRLAV